MKVLKQKTIKRLPMKYLASLLAVFCLSTAHALLPPGSGSPAPTPRPLMPDQPVNIQPAPVNNQPAPVNAQPARPAEVIATPSGVQLPANLEQDLTKMSPSQTRALMDRVKTMKPQQIEELSKAVQNQVQINDNTGLIEAVETSPAPGQAVAVEIPVQARVPVSSTVQVQGVPLDSQSVEIKREEQAFNSIVEDVLPMSPDQIMKLHKFYDLTLQAKATPPNPPPDPRFTSTVVNLEPGSTPPIVRLAAGFVTSVVFVDSTGSAWPISAYSLGDPQTFNVQWDQKGNTLFIQSMKQYSHGNLAVRLYNLNTPVMITLVSGQKNVDFRVDLQIAGRGPNAIAPVIDTAYEVNARVNPLMINILDGIPPKGSIKLGISGGPGDAWLYDHKIYYRSKLTVLSPAWTATTSSPDGTHVYELMQTPRILASQNGKPIDIRLSGY